MRLPAYAKLNLSLFVGPLRPDGYHEISTVMVKVSLCDWLEFSLAPRGVLELSSSSTAIPCDERNTVFKAASLLLDRFSVESGARISINKKIPWGAGLGGGSSDAATTLYALNRLWGLGLSLKELVEIAAMVGSDVPFFFCPSAAVAEGRGEILRPFVNGLTAFPMVVNPGIEIGTAWAYGAISPRLTLDRGVTNIAALSCERGDLRALAQVASNDFEAVVFDRYPVLGDVVDGLRARGAVLAGMSGSGSSLFGVFQGEGERADAVNWARESGFAAWAVEWVFDGV